jgi:hypothetical protein
MLVPVMTCAEAIDVIRRLGEARAEAVELAAHYSHPQRCLESQGRAVRIAARQGGILTLSNAENSAPDRLATRNWRCGQRSMSLLP